MSAGREFTERTVLTQVFSAFSSEKSDQMLTKHAPDQPVYPAVS
jgi:hypothetical protein